MMHLTPKIISVVCLVSLVVGVSLFYAMPGASACSRMMSADNGQAVLTARAAGAVTRRADAAGASPQGSR